MTKTNQMITIHLFTGPADTEGVAVQATVGQTLMAAAVDANVDGIAADCGGTLTCATCHVMVREPWLSRLEAMPSDEDSMLDYAACAREANSRLSCQVKLTAALDGMQVDLPASQY